MSDIIRNYTIYKALSPSGKVYVGLTSNSVEKRKKQHIYKAKKHRVTPFYNALRKYDYNFNWEVLETNLTLEQAEQREKYFITFYKSTDREFDYNLSPGGLSGSIMSEDGKKRHKEKMKEHYNNPEYINLLSKKAKERGNDKLLLGQKKWYSDPKNKLKHSESIKKTQTKERRYSQSKTMGGGPFICIETNEIFNCLQDAVEKLNIPDKRLISTVLNKRRKSTYGYSFRYIIEKKAG